MRNVLIILFILFTSILNATTYYVATDGDDDNAGTIVLPWKTWGKAFNSTSVVAGDSVLFRGGTYVKVLAEGESGWYYPSRSSGGTGYAVSRDGTAENWIVYANYPDEVPVLDCSGAYVANAALTYGIRCTGVNYVKFKGLVVRNVKQTGLGTDASTGWAIAGDPFIIENCKIYDIQGTGLNVRGGATAPAYDSIINCDVWDCIDSLSTDYPGNDGYGFIHSGGGNVYFKGCRAWLCGDYGFYSWTSASSDQTQYSVYDSCWSFRNGVYLGGGMGFTMGWIAYTDANIKRTYKKCLAVYNRQCGWKTLDYKYPHAVYANIYNCIGYYNGWVGNPIGGAAGYFIELDRAKEDVDRVTTELLRTLRNNISYNNENGDIWTELAGATYTHSNNSWDLSVTVTDADFVSVDSTGLAGARGADGSLPVLTFLNLASTSDLIDAGTDVGYDYNNDAPDLGFYEYAEFPPVSAPYINTNEPIITRSRDVTAGGNMIYAGGGTISSKGVCISQEADPDISDTVVYAGTGTDDFTVRVPNLTKSTTYHVRAYATNETGTAYGADVEFTTPASSPVKTGGKLLKHGNYYIKIE